MIQFIAQYWLEVVFGLVCAAVAWVAKHYVSLIRKDKERHEKEILDAIEGKLDEHKATIEQQMDACTRNLLNIVDTKNQELLEADIGIHQEINILKKGILSIEGKTFKRQCHKLLEDNYEISLTEYEDLLKEHDVYNKLGGNHEGDALFSMVEAKYKNSIGK